jgi:DNA polymerase
MNEYIDNARSIKGLAARLEMDANLGMEYASVTSDIASALRVLEGQAGAPEVPAPATGKSGVAVTMAPPAAPARPLAAPVRPPASRGFSLVPPVDRPVNADKDALLAGLRAECMACRACDLCARRNSVVWGEGSLDAGVMFIGEGPGRDEDAEGRPFVGRSGRLLTDIIEKGMKIPRHGVYIANVVKCRPPGNRDPRPDEVAACSRYLARQIEVIAPRVIVAVGNVAGRALLGLGEDASGLRGRWWEHRGLPLRVIYHPSYLLRQRRDEGDRTKADKITWEDIQEVMKKL